MSQFASPDSLVQTLIRRKEDGLVRRVIRDDGLNGLKISDPDYPSSMYPISLEDFQDGWEIHQTLEQQLKESAVPAAKGEDNVGVVTQGVDLTSQVRMPSIDSRQGVDRTMGDKNFGNLNRDPFMGRAVPTPRGDEEALEGPTEDITLSGHPVGGNEEPAETFEEDRADDGMTMPEEEAAEEAPKKKASAKK